MIAVTNELLRTALSWSATNVIPSASDILNVFVQSSDLKTCITFHKAQYQTLIVRQINATPQKEMKHIQFTLIEVTQKEIGNFQPKTEKKKKFYTNFGFILAQFSY